MIKGCQKRVVYLKNTDSCMFDEAYFVLSGEREDKSATEFDMVREAERIAMESVIGEPNRKREKKRRLTFFAMGMLAATGMYAVFGIILYLI